MCLFTRSQQCLKLFSEFPGTKVFNQKSEISVWSKTKKHYGLCYPLCICSSIILLYDNNCLSCIYISASLLSETMLMLEWNHFPLVSTIFLGYCMLLIVCKLCFIISFQAFSLLFTWAQPVWKWNALVIVWPDPRGAAIKQWLALTAMHGWSFIIVSQMRITERLRDRESKRAHG